MKYIVKRIKMIVILGLILLSIGNNAKAEDGRIQIQMGTLPKTEVENFQFSYKKVAEFVDGKYISEEYHQILNIDRALSAAELEEKAGKLAGIVREFDGIATMNDKGSIELEGIAQGLYLFVPNCQNMSLKMEPFLIGMPLWDAKTETMKYDVKVIPKYTMQESERPIAPQTNVNDHIWSNVCKGVLCMIGILFLLFQAKKRGEHEKNH